MRIRNYLDTDNKDLIQLWWDSWHSSASFPHPKPIEEWEERWTELLKTHMVAVAIHDDSLVGFVALNQNKNLLSQLFVSPKFKRKGVGKELFEWAKSNCNNTIRLKTLLENEESRKFYEKLGMRQCGTSINDFNNKEEVEYAL